MFMRYDEFEQLLHGLGIDIVSKELKRIRGYDVDTYRMLAKRTEGMDFDCAEGDSFCRYIHVREGACCLDCVDTCGHWRREGRTLDGDSAMKMAPYCEAQEGFCREGTGCILPRELRSPVCLYHICSDAKLSADDKELLRKLRCGTDFK
jgi:hypothetical protein